MKKLLTLLVALLLLPSCNYQMKSDVVLIKNTIESFYNTQYKSYLEMEYKDITPYLDMTKIQNQNKVVALKALTIRRKYIDEKGYAYVEKKAFPLTFSYKTVDINGESAKVIVKIEIDEHQAYPPFVSYGENTFELNKHEGSWKIVNHAYPGLSNFEISVEKNYQN